MATSNARCPEMKIATSSKGKLPMQREWENTSMRGGFKPKPRQPNAAGASNVKKRMDSKYLHEHFSTCLPKGIAEICHKRPLDPVEYLAQYLLKFKQNEADEAQRKDEEAQLAAEKKEHDEMVERKEELRKEREELARQKFEEQQRLKAEEERLEREKLEAEEAQRKMLEDEEAAKARLAEFRTTESLAPVVEGDEPPEGGEEEEQDETAAAPAPATNGTETIPEESEGGGEGE